MKAMGALAMSLALSACSTEHATSSAIDYGNIEVPEARLSSDAARDRGRRIYQQKCQLCHGEGADGNGALHYLDQMGLDRFCEVAEKYAHLSPLYQPTEKMQAMAASGAKFFQQEGDK